MVCTPHLTSMYNTYLNAKNIEHDPVFSADLFLLELASITTKLCSTKHVFSQDTSKFLHRVIKDSNIYLHGAIRTWKASFSTQKFLTKTQDKTDPIIRKQTNHEPFPVFLLQLQDARKGPCKNFNCKCADSQYTRNKLYT